MANNTSLNVPYIVLSGTVLIGIVLMIAVYQPMISEAVTVGNRLEADRQHLQDRQEILRNMQNRISTLNSQQEHENRLNVVLPKEESMEDVLRILHVASQQSGGEISSVSNSSDSVQSTVNSRRLRGESIGFSEEITPLSFEIRFAGTYRELRVLLEKIEQSPRLLDVSKLSIERAGEGAGEAVSASMTIIFYKYNSAELNT